MSCKLVCLDDYEREARSKLSRSILGYYSSGATSERTLAANVNDFSKYHIRPRFMRDISMRNMKTKILGNEVSIPFGIAPTALHKMANDVGEYASVKVAQNNNSVYTMSTGSTINIEDIATAAPNALKFFQLYVYKDRDLTKSLIQRADAAGFKALVLTVDCQITGIRYADIRNSFDIPEHLRIANFSDGRITGDETSLGNESLHRKYAAHCLDQSLTWDDIHWMKSITKMPIIVKGILTPEDAILAIEHEASAIWVSNHGGRQVDGVLSTIEALPDIVEVINKRCEIYVDGGFRNGSDIFMGLALGADMVFLGRPIIWGLAVAGEEGVSDIFEILKKELDNVLALTGCCTVKDISPDMVRRNRCC